jgi:hypothetical protein
MDNSTVSTLSPPPLSDVLDINNIHMDDQSETPSSASATAAPVLFSLSSSRHRLRPLTTSLGFIRYLFRLDGNQYTIQEKSAIQKRGRSSYI